MREQEIYLAGGCFWGLERLMSRLPGVSMTTAGYANGKSKELANYKTVCRGETLFRETVRVVYDPEAITLDKILFAYFYVIDVTIGNQQGEDAGSQYQTGIYYVDEEAESVVKEAVEKEKEKYDTFAVEVKPLENFYEAEEYHQKYLEKNPDGYCHIPVWKMEEVLSLVNKMNQEG